MSRSSKCDVARRALVSVAVAILLAGALRAQTRTTQPYVGITLIDRVDTSPRPAHMHIARIDLRAPGIRFKVSPPGGTRETVRQRTVDFLRQEHAQLAVNAHFFLPFPSSDADAWAI